MTSRRMWQVRCLRRDLPLATLLLVGVSALLTYRLAVYLPMQTTTSTTQHAAVNATFRFIKESSANSNDANGLEGIYLEAKASNAKPWSNHNEHQTKDKATYRRAIYSRIKQVQQRMFENESSQVRLAVVRIADPEQASVYRDASRRMGLETAELTPDRVADVCFMDPSNFTEYKTLNCRQVNFLAPIYEHLHTTEFNCFGVKLERNSSCITRSNMGCYSPLDEKLSHKLKEPSSDSVKILLGQRDNPAKVTKLSRDAIQPISDDNFTQQRFVRIRGDWKELQSRLYTLQGQSFMIKIQVLITSVFPLRAYVHEECRFYSASHTQENELSLLPALKTHMSRNYGSELSSRIIDSMFRAVLQTLLMLESDSINIMAENNDNHSFRHFDGFQFMEFTLVVDFTSADMTVNVVNVREKRKVNEDIAEDILKLIIRKYQNIYNIYRLLLALNFNVDKIPCQVTNGCLDDRMLHYLVEFIHERNIKSRFSVLFPNTEYDLELETSKCNLFKSTRQLPHNIHHSTLGVHSSLLGIASYLENMDILATSYDARMYPMSWHNRNHSANRNCSRDYNHLPLLRHLSTSPYVTLTPRLTANSTQYFATTAYDVIFTTVVATPMSCYCQAVFDHKYGPVGSSKYSLGLGLSTITIHVVDMTHSAPWVVNVYTLHITREHPGLSSSPSPTIDIQEAMPCSFRQNCDFIYQNTDTCGLQNYTYATWWQFEKQRKSLPSCTTGDASGEWLVPCKTCQSRDSCDWPRAIWQPFSCTHAQISQPQLKQCLTNKQLLFIGDSTNRGMLHYIMEQVNGSLTERDKTHDIRTYSYLNRGSTHAAFAYYPQFWLPPAQRPNLSAALNQLLSRVKSDFGLSRDGRDTILVVGGVHWLATQHLWVVRDTLSQWGLSQTQLVVKGLGAGFHQPVDGLHRLTMDEQRKLVAHNGQLLATARDMGFKVVDTLHMTMVRYKDFLQGKCACHFHVIQEIIPSFTDLLHYGQWGADGLSGDLPITYHVAGDINRAYTDILTSQICSAEH